MAVNLFAEGDKTVSRVTVGTRAVMIPLGNQGRR
jgi:hypothetical protein